MKQTEERMFYFRYWRAVALVAALLCFAGVSRSQIVVEGVGADAVVRNVGPDVVEVAAVCNQDNFCRLYLYSYQRLEPGAVERLFVEGARPVRVSDGDTWTVRVWLSESAGYVGDEEVAEKLSIMLDELDGVANGRPQSDEFGAARLMVRSKLKYQHFIEREFGTAKKRGRPASLRRRMLDRLSPAKRDEIEEKLEGPYGFNWRYPDWGCLKSEWAPGTITCLMMAECGGEWEGRIIRAGWTATSDCVWHQLSAHAYFAHQSVFAEGSITHFLTGAPVVPPGASAEFCSGYGYTDGGGHAATACGILW